MGLKSIVTSAGFLVSSVLAQDADVVLATLEYPPHLGEHLEGNGALIEITKAAFAHHDLSVEVLFLPWRRALDWADQGRIDGMIGVWYTKQRSKSFYYSDPIYPNQMVFYQGKKAKVSFDSFKDLAEQNKIVGSVRGYAHVKGLEQSGVEIRYVNNDIQNFKLLERGRIDLVTVDKDYASYVLRLPELANIADQLEPFNRVLEVKQQHLIISHKAKDAKTKLAAFNTGLKKMKQDGKIKAILQKYQIDLPAEFE